MAVVFYCSSFVFAMKAPRWSEKRLVLEKRVGPICSSLEIDKGTDQVDRNFDKRNRNCVEPKK